MFLGVPVHLVRFFYTYHGLPTVKLVGVKSTRKELVYVDKWVEVAEVLPIKTTEGERGAERLTFAYTGRTHTRAVHLE